MSKVVLGAVALGLNGAVIAGGGWLIHTGLQKQKAVQVDAELADSLESFKTNGKDEGCVTFLFGKLESLPSTTDATTPAENIEANFFGEQTSDTTTGCLVVNWDKVSYADSKWNGNIRFLWAVRGSSNKGFIVYLLGTATNESSTQSIKWTGVAYTLTRTGDDQAWTAKKKSDVSTSTGTDVSFKKVDSDAENNKKKFPGPGTTLKMGENSDFWGFFGSVDDLANICESSGCSDPSTKTQFRGYWDWKGVYGASATTDNQKQKLSDWVEDLEKSCKAIFGEQCKVKELADKQVGTWTEIFREPNVKTSAAVAQSQ